MATTQHTIDVIINAMDQTGQGLQSVSSNFSDSLGKISSLTAPLAGVADKVLETEAAVTALGLAFLTLAVNEADDFAGKMAEINSLTNGNEDSFNTLSKSIQDYAVTSTSSIESINDAMYNTVSVIGDNEKSLELLQTAQRGATVGATDLNTAASLLANIMAAYGQSSQSGADYTNALEMNMAAMFATVQNGKTTINELSSAIGGMAPLASAANVDIKTLGASIAAITSVGISTSEAGTKISALLEELLNPGKELQKVLQGLSIQTDGLPAILNRLQEATGGATDEMYGLFSSSEAANAALILSTDKSGKFKSTLDAMKDSAKNFNEQYENMAGGVGDSTAILANSFTVLLQKIGAPLADEFAAILDSFSKITQGFSISIDDGTFDPVFEAFNDFQKDIVDYLDQVAAALPKALEKVDFSKWIASMQQLGLDIGSIFDGADLTTPEGLAHAIQLVVDGLETLNQLAAGIISVWSPVIRTFFSAAEAFINMDASTDRSIGKLLGISQVFEALKGYVEGGLSAIDGIGKALQFIAGIKVVESLATLGPSLASIGVTAPQLALAAAAIALISYDVKAYYDIYKEGQRLQESAAQSNRNYQNGLSELSASYKDIAEKTGVAIKDTADFHKKVDEGTLIFNKATQSWQSGAQFLADISKSTGIAFKSQDEFNQAIKDGIVIFDQASGQYVTREQQVNELANSTKKAELSNESWIASVDKVANSMGLADSKGRELVASFLSLDAAEKANAETLIDGYQRIIKYEDGMYNIYQVAKDTTKQHEDLKAAVEDTTKSNVRGSEEWKRVQDAMQAATDSAREFELKAAELNEKRFEAILTASVDLKVAEVEAQTERIKSAFESLNTGIESTGDTLSSLADTLSNNFNPNNESILKDMLKQENERRQQEFDLQKSLTEQEIQLNQLKIEKLKQGDSLIKIDAGGLGIHLQALLTEIFNEIKIKATSEEAKYTLLGI